MEKQNHKTLKSGTSIDTERMFHNSLERKKEDSIRVSDRSIGHSDEPKAPYVRRTLKNGEVKNASSVYVNVAHNTNFSSAYVTGTQTYLDEQSAYVHTAGNTPAVSPYTHVEQRHEQRSEYTHIKSNDSEPVRSVSRELRRPAANTAAHSREPGVQIENNEPVIGHQTPNHVGLQRDLKTSDKSLRRTRVESTEASPTFSPHKTLNVAQNNLSEVSSHNDGMSRYVHINNTRTANGADHSRYVRELAPTKETPVSGGTIAGANTEPVHGTIRNARSESKTIRSEVTQSIRGQSHKTLRTSNASNETSSAQPRLIVKRKLNNQERLNNRGKAYTIEKANEVSKEPASQTQTSVKITRQNGKFVQNEGKTSLKIHNDIATQGIIKGRLGDNTSLSAKQGIKEDPSIRGNVSKRMFMEKQSRSSGTGEVHFATGRSGTGYAGTRKAKMKVISKARTGEITGKPMRQTASKAGTMQSPETVKAMWMKAQQRNALLQRNATGATDFLGNLKGAFQNIGRGIGGGIGSIAVAVALVVTSVISLLSPIGDAVGFMPNAAHYYTDGSAPTGEEEAEHRNDLMTGVAKLLGLHDATEEEAEGKPILITQAAVNGMYREQRDFGDIGSKTEGMLKGMKLKGIKDRGKEVTGLVDNLVMDFDFYSYVGSNYTYVGKAVDEEGNPLTAPERREIYSSVLQENKAPEKGRFFSIVYHFDGGTKSCAYYANPDAFTNGQYQYFGAKAIFDEEDSKQRYLSGWKIPYGIIPGYTHVESDELMSSSMASYMYARFKTSGESIHLYAEYTSFSSTYTTDIACVSEEEVAAGLNGTISEDDVRVIFKYTDKDDGTEFEIPGYAHPFKYSRDQLYKLILGMATVASGNDYTHPDEYIEYCESLIKQAIKNYSGYSVEYKVKSLTNTANTGLGVEWKQDDTRYIANGARLVPTITVYVDANPYDLFKTDDVGKDGVCEYKFIGWDHDSDATKQVMEYMTIDTEEFLDLFQVYLPTIKGSASEYGSNPLYVYHYLIGEGYSEAAAFAILGNLAAESGMGLDPTAENTQNEGYVAQGIFQDYHSIDTQGRLEQYAEATAGETWPNISIETQTACMVYLLEERNSWGIDSEAYYYWDADYLNLSVDEFKELDDMDQAVILFLTRFEKPGNYRYEAKHRIELANAMKEQIGAMDSYMAIAHMIADDDRYGYAWASDTPGHSRNDYLRWGLDGDTHFDCTSFVYYCFLEAGWDVDVKYVASAKGNTEVLGNAPTGRQTFIDIWTSYGFEVREYPGGMSREEVLELPPGTILDSSDHTGFYAGDGKTLDARYERGIHDDTPGDQSGQEISEVSWDYWGDTYWDMALIPPEELQIQGTMQDFEYVPDINKLTFVDQDSVTSGYSFTLCEAKYNDGVMADGMAISSTLEPGTLIYVSSHASGAGAAANGKYYLVTCQLESLPEDVIYLYHGTSGTTKKIGERPYGATANIKVFIAGTGVNWGRYQKRYAD